MATRHKPDADGWTTCWLCGVGGWVGRELRLGIHAYICVDAEGCINRERGAIALRRTACTFERG